MSEWSATPNSDGEKFRNYEDIDEIKELYRQNGKLNRALAEKGNVIERKQPEIKERLGISDEDC